LEEAVNAARGADPQAILKELDRMWAAAGKEEGEGVLRACTLTLIVLSGGPATHELLQDLGELMPRHPCRAILVLLDPQSRALEAEASIQCWLPFGTRRQVCSESIRISAPPGSLPHVAPIAASLAAPDLPVVFYCRDPALMNVQGFGPLAAVADKLILDSGQAPWPLDVLDALAAPSKALPPIADLAWTRITPWRETITRVFEDPGCRRRLDSLAQIVIAYEGRAVPVTALYLAGWLVRSLGLRREGPQWRSASQQVALRLLSLREAEAGRIFSCALSGQDWEVGVSLGPGRCVEIRLDSLVTHTLFGDTGETALLSEELRITGRDPVQEESRARAREIAGMRA
jgi:glucose-6-phosphate dehydrogenase assembly protein OpcA